MIKLKYTLALFVILFSILYANSFTKERMDCDAGNAEACYKEAEAYAFTSDKIKKLDIQRDAQQAIVLYKKSCTLGYAKGCSQYGMRYAADTEKDPSKNDAYYFQKACDGGDLTGCTLLKMMTLRK